MQLRLARPLLSRWIGLLCLSAIQTAHAADLMDSPACHDAMAAWQHEEQRLAAAPAADRTPWQRLRQQAATACLGAAASHPMPRRGSVSAPVSVAPSTADRARSGTAPPSTAASPAVRPEPLRAITSCDAAGCWTSDGGRVQRMGPDLVGPRGICTVQGAVLTCP